MHLYWVFRGELEGPLAPCPWLLDLCLETPPEEALPEESLSSLEPLPSSLVLPFFKETLSKGYEVDHAFV